MRERRSVEIPRISETARVDEVGAKNSRGSEGVAPRHMGNGILFMAKYFCAGTK